MIDKILWGILWVVVIMAPHIWYNWYIARRNKKWKERLDKINDE